MTPADLKNHLIQRISEIDDASFLEAIKTILDSKSEIFRLSPIQKAEIKQSQDQIDKGLFTSQEQVDEEFEKWVIDN